ncbi:BMC domain-containing protein [Lentilactobacillus raoultii]|uniref:BMC domain-containing protein n=1 Tax=Lentilactobacillus raoultii TaxID=1987503 RepID=A0ABW3PKR1_9LACO|nr:BMC domain-containing protein [Lentilactobacillus raoultii]
MQSIGYIEVVGLSSAIVVSDKMLKTAAVSIRNVENTKGGGYITVSITGDVSAVQAAIDTGQSISDVQVVSAVVIANPAEGIPDLGKTDAFKDRAPFTDDSPIVDSTHSDIAETAANTGKEKVVKKESTTKPKTVTRKTPRRTNNSKTPRSNSSNTNRTSKSNTDKGSSDSSNSNNKK